MTSSDWWKAKACAQSAGSGQAREPAQAVERFSRTDLCQGIQPKGDGNLFPFFARRGGQTVGTRLKLSQ
jgi:hypothetical protein